MKNNLIRFLTASALAAMIFVACGCAGGKALRTQPIQDDGEIAGLFTLTLYSDMQYASLRTLAFLGLEGSGYSLSPYVPSFDLNVLNNVPGQEALREALAFISSKNPNYENPAISRILDPTGKVIGYEVRPLYNPVAYGLSNVLSTGYFLLPSGTVRIIINLNEEVKNQFEDSAGR
ncbi:MAG TPA: hypothetical protein VEI96_11100 [Thermodesulfovibrionales bacterium]|nr:hypothetical protein [Thermodesulfovibrionales bacterium]